MASPSSSTLTTPPPSSSAAKGKFRQSTLLRWIWIDKSSALDDSLFPLSPVDMAVHFPSEIEGPNQRATSPPTAKGDSIATTPVLTPALVPRLLSSPASRSSAPGRYTNRRVRNHSPWTTNGVHLATSPAQLVQILAKLNERQDRQAVLLKEAESQRKADRREAQRQRAKSEQLRVQLERERVKLEQERVRAEQERVRAEQQREIAQARLEQRLTKAEQQSMADKAQMERQRLVDQARLDEEIRHRKTALDNVQKECQEDKAKSTHDRLASQAKYDNMERQHKAEKEKAKEQREHDKAEADRRFEEVEKKRKKAEQLRLKDIVKAKRQTQAWKAAEDGLKMQLKRAEDTIADLNRQLLELKGERDQDRHAINNLQVRLDRANERYDVLVDHVKTLQEDNSATVGWLTGDVGAAELVDAIRLRHLLIYAQENLAIAAGLTTERFEASMVWRKAMKGITIDARVKHARSLLQGHYLSSRVRRFMYSAGMSLVVEEKPELRTRGNRQAHPAVAGKASIYEDIIERHLFHEETPALKALVVAFADT
ncbi:hypothetical protein BV25DRAFT_1437068 [Artomyces pyxidatus]|uniref:Uncharacterized protein n=1 Tax=Artomyces pyxidatus TaxID=48021 RepID=A0ACB8SMC3_9AGAM|nr:hypothetical protein BV25DRAFT_1437068 [Artomyces pyxidatus]